MVKRFAGSFDQHKRQKKAKIESSNNRPPDLLQPTAESKKWIIFVPDKSIENECEQAKGFMGNLKDLEIFVSSSICTTRFEKIIESWSIGKWHKPRLNNWEFLVSSNDVKQGIPRDLVGKVLAISDFRISVIFSNQKHIAVISRVWKSNHEPDSRYHPSIGDWNSNILV